LLAPGPRSIELARLVDLERQCCAFLTFRITVVAGKPICLEISGPPEAKPVIADFFGSLNSQLTMRAIPVRGHYV